jgi:hypothetical protein
MLSIIRIEQSCTVDHNLRPICKSVFHACSNYIPVPISSRPECTVSLGLYEDEARDVLFGLKPLSGFDAFQVLVQRYRSTGIDVDRFYTLPVLAPFETLNAYGLSLLGYRITCKIIQGRCLTIVLHLLSMASRLYKVLLSISSRRRNLAEQYR